VSGRIQRRTKKKKPAREALEQARAIFDELGAPLWSAKASPELARIGGRTSTENELTATEIRVASLVAEGHTNREVANALFMSIHTVDANLRRIYRKLGVRSRSQLAGRF